MSKGAASDPRCVLAAGVLTELVAAVDDLEREGAFAGVDEDNVYERALQVGHPIGRESDARGLGGRLHPVVDVVLLLEVDSSPATTFRSSRE